VTEISPSRFCMSAFLVITQQAHHNRVLRVISSRQDQLHHGEG
jgi:hypothetical protein